MKSLCALQVASIIIKGPLCESDKRAQTFTKGIALAFKVCDYLLYLYLVER